MNTKNNKRGECTTIDQNVTNWYSKKTKLKNMEDIKKLQTYLVKSDQNIGEKINLSYDYEFTYFSLDKIDCKSIQVRPENVCKINFYRVIKKLQQYFSNKIIIEYEVRGDNEIQIKNNMSGIEYDIYIKIYDDDNNFYDIGIEYNESHHDNQQERDRYKYVNSTVNLDRFYVYEEKYDDYNNFMKETIESIFIFICSSNNDKYTFSKIIYFKNYCNEKSLEKDTGLFNTILNFTSKKSFNLKLFFNNAEPFNSKTEDYFEFDEFIEYLSDNKIKIEYEDDKFNCKDEYFTNIIMRIDSNCSAYIYNLRMMYARTMKTLQEASDLIFNAEKSSRDSKKLIPEYTENLLLYDITKIKNKNILEKVKKQLNKKKK